MKIKCPETRNDVQYM